METIQTFYARRDAIRASGSAEDQAALRGIESMLEVSPVFLDQFGHIPLVSTPLILVVTVKAGEEESDYFDLLFRAWEYGTHLRRLALEALPLAEEEAPDQDARASIMLALARRIITLAKAELGAWEPA